MPLSTNTKITFSLEVGAHNRGTEGPIPSAFSMGFEGIFLASFGGGAPGYTGGSYEMDEMELSTDATGASSLSTFSRAGLDLHAAFDEPGLVRIPLSLQTLDLGVLAGGERLLIAYRASILIDQNGFSEGVTARFSDPFTLMRDSILSNVTFTPVPETAALTLSLTAFLGLCVLKGRRHSAATRLVRDDKPRAWVSLNHTEATKIVATERLSSPMAAHRERSICRLTPLGRHLVQR